MAKTEINVSFFSHLRFLFSTTICFSLLSMKAYSTVVFSLFWYDIFIHFRDNVKDHSLQNKTDGPSRHKYLGHVS